MILCLIKRLRLFYDNQLLMSIKIIFKVISNGQRSHSMHVSETMNELSTFLLCEDQNRHTSNQNW